MIDSIQHLGPAVYTLSVVFFYLKPIIYTIMGINIVVKRKL